jgi:DNA-directed RNA polymerase subunit H (RpoH/RPB5)
MKKKSMAMMLAVVLLGVTQAVAFHKKNHVHPMTETKCVSKSPKVFKTYDEVVAQLNIWHQQLPAITEIGAYGKTSLGTLCNYLRVGTVGKPKVLIQAGLEGDEEFAILANMKFMEKFLCRIDTDDDVNWLVKNRDIYFIPVLSPDTFLKSHDIEGFETIRSFPYPAKPNNQSPSPVKLIIDLANELKFKAVLSSHTYGEKFVQPQICNGQDGDKIEHLLLKLSGMNGFKTERADNPQGTGSDVDWFYSIGACSVNMLWSKNSKQFVSFSDLEPSVDRNFAAVCAFMKEAVEIEMNPKPLRPMLYQAE